MQEIIVDIRISSDEFLKFYRGEAHTVSSWARDGRRVRFPAEILKPFVTRDGIAGSFAILFDASGKFKSIRPLA